MKKRTLLIAACLLLTGCLEESHCMFDSKAQIKPPEPHQWSEWKDVGWVDRGGARQVERQCENCKRKQLKELN